MDPRFQALNSSLISDAGLGYWTLIVIEIPDFKGHDSGFHRQDFSDSGMRIPLREATCTSGVTLKDWGQRIQQNLPTPGNKVRARLPANDSARRPATLYSKSRPYTRYPALCSEKKRKSQINFLLGRFHTEAYNTVVEPATSMYFRHGVFTDHIIFRIANF